MAGTDPINDMRRLLPNHTITQHITTTTVQHPPPSPHTFGSRSEFLFKRCGEAITILMSSLINYYEIIETMLRNKISTSSHFQFWEIALRLKMT